MIRGVSAPSFAAYASGTQEYDMEAVLENCAVPMLFMAGTNDGKIAQDFERIAARLRQASCQLIEGAGHLPNVEAPDMFNRLLAAFLSRVDAGAGHDLD
jgi:3-oxoadipate enol-lactonase